MKIYKSKISVGLIVFFLLLTIVQIYNFILSQDWVILFVILFFLIIFYQFFNTKYTFEKENLNVRFGFFLNKNIDIKTIRKISETNNLSSAPAASSDRLEIQYNVYNIILVSPKDKNGFIDSLLAINPNIEVEYRKKQ